MVPVPTRFTRQSRAASGSISAIPNAPHSRGLGSGDELDLLPGGISTSVHPAHALGALLVGGLLLSALVADDALVMATVG
jgi:hypothetical protein